MVSVPTSSPPWMRSKRQRHQKKKKNARGKSCHLARLMVARLHVALLFELECVVGIYRVPTAGWQSAPA